MYGFLLVLFSSLLHGFEPCVRSIPLAAGISPVEVNIFCSAVLLVIATADCLFKKSTVRIPAKHAVQLLVFGGIGIGLTRLLLTLSYQYIGVGTTTVIHFLYPTLVCIVMAIWLRQHLTTNHIMAIVLSIAGLVCISFDSLSAGSLLGIFFAVLSAFTFLVYIVVIDSGSSGNVRLNVKLFYIALGCLAVNLACYPFMEHSVAALGRREVWLLISCGIMTYLSTGTFTAGIRYIGAAKASFCSLLEPGSALVFSAMLYHTHFTVMAVVGIFLLLGSIVFISLPDTKQKTGAVHHSCGFLTKGIRKGEQD